MKCWRHQLFVSRWRLNLTFLQTKFNVVWIGFFPPKIMVDWFSIIYFLVENSYLKSQNQKKYMKYQEAYNECCNLRLILFSIWLRDLITTTLCILNTLCEIPFNHSSFIYQVKCLSADLKGEECSIMETVSCLITNYLHKRSRSTRAA